MQNRGGSQKHGVLEANNLINHDVRRILFVEYLLRFPGKIRCQTGKGQYRYQIIRPEQKRKDQIYGYTNNRPGSSGGKGYISTAEPGSGKLYELFNQKTPLLKQTDIALLSTGVIIIKLKLAINN